MMDYRKKAVTGYNSLLQTGSENGSQYIIDRSKSDSS